MSTPRETFQSLLREMFQIEAAAELDFGIYRILGQKRGVVEKFINEQLVDAISAELNSGALRQEAGIATQIADLAAQIRENIADDAIDAAGNLAASHHGTKLGRQYLALQQQAKGARPANDREASIYNHLVQFFSRYYDNGDFLSLRRYSKREKYAIPYNGEEVHLHWANADQYYIKTGEQFTEYRWRDPSGGVRARFTVTQADVPKDNIKSPDTRYFLPQTDALTLEQAGAPKDKHTLVTLPFHYRGLTAAEADRFEQEAKDRGITSNGKIQQAILAVAAETLAKSKTLKETPEALNALLAEHHKDADSNPVSRLAHHLRRFSRKNSSDYFIHKDLEGFLSRELDFYLKNEVLQLDSLDAGGEERAEGWFQMMRLIRRIGHVIIRFLAQIENFQKRIFEKKKFVTSSHFCLTLDRIPESLYPEIAKNSAQIAEWKRLFSIQEAKGWTETPPVAFLKKNWNLVVDTKFFDEEFVDAALAAQPDIEAGLGGLAIHSENFQGLSLVEELYRERSKCIYIDPPYNTSSSAILYKNDYRHSSWATFMRDRLAGLWRLLKNDGAVFVSIDKTERQILEVVLDAVFGAENYVEELIWTQNTANSQLPNYSTNHEYVEVFAKNRSSAEQDPDMFRQMKPGCSEVLDLVRTLNPEFPSIDQIESAVVKLYEEHLASFRDELESKGIEWNSETQKLDPWKGIYPYSRAEYRSASGEYVPEEKARQRKAEIWVWSAISLSAPAAKQSPTTKDKNHPNFRFYKPAHPVTGKPCPHPRGGWKCPQLSDPDNPERRSFLSLQKDSRIAWGEDDQTVPRIKGFLHEVETNIGTSVFYDYNDGEAQLADLFGESGLFLSPKNSRFPGRFIDQATRKTDVVVDCFGGSGSTPHGVMDLNRVDGGMRSYVVMEQGDHFETLVRPRLQKVIYSPDWKAGKPQARDAGISHCFQYVKLESYEDALGNIAFNENEAAQRQLRFDEYVIHYMLAFETGQSETLLDCEKLATPFDYKLEIRDNGDTAVKAVDLPATFNFLIGLRVRTRKVYWRMQGKQKLRYLVYRGRTNPHATGGEREVAVVWRTTDGWGLKDFQADREFIRKEKILEGTDEAFANTDCLMEGIKSLDPVFKRRMFNQEETV